MIKYIYLTLEALLAVNINGSSPWSRMIYDSSAKITSVFLALQATATSKDGIEGSKTALKTVPPGLVRVYHVIGRGGTLDSVRVHGLLTHNEAFKKGVTQQKPIPRNSLSGVPWTDQSDLIYFKWEPSPPKSMQSVGLDVDPNTTYVRNRELRGGRFNNIGGYQSSTTLLADYIARRKEGEELSKTLRPGQIIAYDPYTSKPFAVNGDDLRLESSLRYMPSAEHYYYPNEITFSVPCIPAKELIFPEEDALRAPL